MAVNQLVPLDRSDCIECQMNKTSPILLVSLLSLLVWEAGLTPLVSKASAAQLSGLSNPSAGVQADAREGGLEAPAPASAATRVARPSK